MVVPLQKGEEYKNSNKQQQKANKTNYKICFILSIEILARLCLHLPFNAYRTNFAFNFIYVSNTHVAKKNNDNVENLSCIVYAKLTYDKLLVISEDMDLIIV